MPRARCTSTRKSAPVGGERADAAVGAVDLAGPFLINDLINQPMLDVDPSRIDAVEVSDQFFMGRRVPERVAFKNRQERLRLLLQPGSRQLFGILLRLFGLNEHPSHQSSSLAHSLTGVADPSRIDSRVPGTDRRNRAS